MNSDNLQIATRRDLSGYLTKGNYIFNTQLCEYIPGDPVKALEMFDSLASKITCNDGEALVIAISNIAIALGYRIAVKLHGDFVRITDVDLTGEYYNFGDYKLTKNLDYTKYKNIFLVTDILVTGKVIFNIQDKLSRDYPNIIIKTVTLSCDSSNKSVISLYDTSNPQVNDSIHSAVNMRHKRERNYTCDIPMHIDIDLKALDSSLNYGCDTNKVEPFICGEVSAITKTIKKNLIDIGSILIVNTWEYTYPALILGEKLSKSGYKTRVQSETTVLLDIRSNEKLTNCYSWVSYNNRSYKDLFLYNIASYDLVIIVGTDTFVRKNPVLGEYLSEHGEILMSCMYKHGNKNVIMIQSN